MNPLADIRNLCFWDVETRAFADARLPDSNLKTAGTYRYARSSFTIVSTWAIAEQPVFDVSMNGGFEEEGIYWEDLPASIHEFYKRVEQREAWFAGFNAGFDKAAWNASHDLGWPVLEADMVIDVMVQATASNLAPSLEGASRNIGNKGKQDDGKALIAMFCGPNGATPQSHPQEWLRFRSYGRRDTDETRDIWRSTRPLPFEEWEDYWVSEKINERGVPIDVEFARRAALVAEAESARLNRELARWTNGQIIKVTQAQRIAEWVYDRIESAEARELLVKEWNEDASTEDGLEADVKVGKLSLERSRIDALLAYYKAREQELDGLTDAEWLIVDVLTARQFGGSASPFKFQKMLDQQTDGVLRGQYVFNGAQQTGRFSSKGVQMHNLKRDSLGKYEELAMETINELEA